MVPQKNGEMLPGKKGISLKPAEFDLIYQHSTAISAAAASRNMGYALDLGSK